ncbi:hypothetical protein NFI96_000253 [Prochilodus magdalenae]|nr:hypothetical protein NFI96_000253 [Prochilodus magdalenae]
MDDCALSFWIYMVVMSVFVGGTLKKFLVSHVSAMPSLVAWLGAILLVERLCALCMPAVLALAALCAACWLYATWAAPEPTLPVEGKAVFITGLLWGREVVRYIAKPGHFCGNIREILELPELGELCTICPVSKFPLESRKPISRHHADARAVSALVCDLCDSTQRVFVVGRSRKFNQLLRLSSLKNLKANLIIKRIVQPEGSMGLHID